MVILRDVAKKVGVSVATVSSVLNNRPSKVPISDETKKKVLKTVKELNYYPNIFARALRTKITGIVAVVVTDIKDPYFNAIVDGVEQILEENGYYFLLMSAHNSPRKEKLYLNKLRKSRVDGLLVLSGVMQFTNNMIRELSRSKIPIVLVAHRAPVLNISSVEVDNFKGGFLATEHLISLGHSDITHITTSYQRPDAQHRLNGYVSAMEKYGLANKCWIQKGGDTVESGYEAMTHVLQKDKRPTAVFAFNDRSAFGVIKALRNRELRVPQDVAVVGFDDITFAAHFCPPLTTMQQPSTEMGRRGAEFLLKAIKERDTGTGEHIVFPPKLIVRGSSVVRGDTQK